MNNQSNSPHQYEQLKLLGNAPVMEGSKGKVDLKVKPASGLNSKNGSIHFSVYQELHEVAQ
jgi:hypothetical protein